MPIELPRVDEGLLQTMTLEAIDRVMKVAAIELDDADVNRFSTVFWRHLGPHIGTPRMAKRIVNAVEFAVPLVAGEVNVTDFLLMETIRVLFPAVHKKMPDFKDALLGTPFNYPINNVEQLVRQQLEPLFDGLEDSSGQHVRDALRQLFPRIERIYSNYHYGTESIPGWHAAQRICAPDYFDRFFAYGIPIGDLADADLSRFIDRLQGQTEPEVAQTLGALYKSRAPLGSFRSFAHWRRPSNRHKPGHSPTP